jgi:hypothetical protein
LDEQDFTNKGVAMKAVLPWLAAILITMTAGSLAKADPYYYYPCRPQAPDACGMGYYCPNYCGAIYGPNYNVYPPFPPFNGVRPDLGGCAKFPTHPFAHGPRDFFMVQ